jgi:hypothetical protein
MKTVELKTAYHWHCDKCASENFVMPQKAELTEEEAEEAYRKFNDLESWADLPDDWRNFELVQRPNYVICDKCEERYCTIDETTADF